MYYILNETGQIIAADDQLLRLGEVSHIDELSSNIIQRDTIFDLMSENTLNVTTGGNVETFAVVKTSLSSMLGNLTLVSLSTEDEETESVTPLLDELNIHSNIEEETNDTIDSILDINDDTEDSENALLDNLEMNDDDEISTFNLDDTKETETSLEPVDDSELFNLIDNDEKEDAAKTSTESITSNISDDTPFALNLDNDELFADTPKVVNDSEITIDVENISRKIGISTDDYNQFLNEFIDAALELEKDLQSSELEMRSEAIGTLSHLSDVLHLPEIGDILDTITNAEEGERREVIESFYNTLSRITTSSPTPDETEIVDNVVEETPSVIEEDTLELFEEPETIREPMIQEEVAPRHTTSEGSFGTISLEGIKPKHFDFQLEEAANDLSLPIELIEEFVQDFIDQAHIETKKMLAAYEEGDFDTIKKIGHLLKGASSNLRINALSDTLYKIQFCEDTSTLEPLIKDYWAHFLSFENQINVISN